MNQGREQFELAGKSVSGVSGAAKDPCLQSVAVRLERWHMSGYTAAIGIAKLLGQDEIVAMLSEGHEEKASAAPLPAVRAYAEMVDEDRMNVSAALKLRKVAHR